MIRTKWVLGLLAAATAVATAGSAYAFRGGVTVDTTTRRLSGNAVTMLLGPKMPASAHVFATHDWNPAFAPPTYWPHPLAYTPENGFALLDVDGAAMAPGLGFFVVTIPDGPSAFLHTATAADTSSSRTYLSNPRLDGHPDAILQVSQRGTVDPHVIGVAYDRTVGKWEILNEDGARMPVGASFSVYIGTSDSAVFRCDHDHVAGDVCFLSRHGEASPVGPQARLIVTHNRSPIGGATVAEVHPVGVYWDVSGRWGIYNEDRAPMGLGEAFNVSADVELTPP